MYRIATLNLRHGGSKNAGALAARLLGYDANVLVLTEYRASIAGMRLAARLRDAGYGATSPSTLSGQNTVLIASLSPISRAGPFDDDLDERHLWCVTTNGLTICGVYLPQAKAKLPYWEAMIAKGPVKGVDLFVGDFNTGSNDLDKDPRATKFVGAHLPERLTSSGFTDVWRSKHPIAREYSWYSHPGGNGFRLDYAYAAPAVAARVRSCEFDHVPRLEGETDHSALVFDLD